MKFVFHTTFDVFAAVHHSLNVALCITRWPGFSRPGYGVYTIGYGRFASLRMKQALRNRARDVTEHRGRSKVGVTLSRFVVSHTRDTR